MYQKFRKLWKKFWEPILRLSFFQWIMAGLMALAIWFVYFTCRKKITGWEIFKKYRRKPAIFVFWHGRSMMLSPIVCLGGMRAYAVASRHKDGRMMAKLQRLFGLKSIYGSTSDGGISVLRQLYFAKMTGAPIIPVCYSASHSWFQKRWDRYLVALPFSTITCKIHKPVFIDSKVTPEEFEKLRKQIEDIMVRQVREMDGEFNLFQVEQDETAAEFKKKLRASEKNKKQGK